MFDWPINIIDIDIDAKEEYIFFKYNFQYLVGLEGDSVYKLLKHDEITTEDSYRKQRIKLGPALKEKVQNMPENRTK